MSLYAVLPAALQHLVTAGYGVALRRRRAGRRFQETRRALAASERLRASELADLQSRELRRVVAHAARATPYYARWFAESGVDPDKIRTPADLPRLPLLDKAALFEHADALHARGVAGVRTYYTSGTSGTALAIPIDDASRRRNYAFFARALGWAGVEGGRSATFAGRPVVPAARARPATVWRWNPALRNRLYSSYHLNEANAPAYAKSLCRYAADYLDSYPSAVSALAGLIEEAGLPAPRPRAVITSSETLLDHDRERIERVFEAPCFDQYGCTEQSLYVSQCGHGRYHVHPEYGIVEVLRPDGRPAGPGEVGEVVCTSFCNDALPLLRYRIGDSAVAGEPGCACGRRFPVLEQIVGRTDDVLETPDGRRIGRLDPVFKGRRTIRLAQIVQEEPARVVVRVVPGPGYADPDGDAVVRELRARLGPEVRVELLRVPEIPLSASGKFPAVVNRLRRDAERCREPRA